MGCSQSKSTPVENPVRNVKSSPKQQEEPTQTQSYRESSSSEQVKDATKHEQSSSHKAEVICEDSNPTSPKMEVVLSPVAKNNDSESDPPKKKGDEIKEVKTEGSTESSSPDSRTNTPRRRRTRSISSGVEAMQESGKEMELDVAKELQVPKLQPVKKKDEAAAPEKKEVKKPKEEDKSIPEPVEEVKKEAPAAASVQKADMTEKRVEKPKPAASAVEKKEEVVSKTTDEKPPQDDKAPETKKCAGCDTAETSPGSFKLCAKCKDVKYCSRDCQRAHWKVHKFQCGKGLDVTSSHLKNSQNFTNTTAEEKPLVETKSSSSEDGAKELEERLESIRNDPSAEEEKKKSDAMRDAVVEDPVDAAREQADKENNENVAPSTSPEGVASGGDSDAKPEVRTCEGCNAVEETRGEYKYCAKCNVSVYCSRACQKKHWKHHKKVCCKQDPSARDVTASTEPNRQAVAAK